MDKFKLIAKIIFGEEDISKIKFPVNEDVKQNFEIAWDIREKFDEIRISIRKRLVKELYEKLKQIFQEEKYKNYKIIDEGFLKGEIYGRLYLFPKEWQLNEIEKPLISYALEFEKYNYLALGYGIVKKDKNTPYLGKTPKNFDELKNIQEELQKEQGFWATEMYLSWKYFEKWPYSENKLIEFYYDIFENINNIVSFYVEEVKSLIEKTQNKLNEFIKTYKK